MDIEFYECVFAVDGSNLSKIPNGLHCSANQNFATHISQNFDNSIINKYFLNHVSSEY